MLAKRTKMSIDEKRKEIVEFTFSACLGNEFGKQAGGTYYSAKKRKKELPHAATTPPLTPCLTHRIRTAVTGSNRAAPAPWPAPPAAAPGCTFRSSFSS